MILIDSFINKLTQVLGILPSFIPSPPYNSFSLGPVKIHFYAICILTGVFIAALITYFITRKAAPGLLDFDTLLELICWVIPVSIIGARLYHCVTVPQYYFPPTGDLMNILWVQNGGLGIMGGMLFGVITGGIFCKVKKISFFAVVNFFAPSILVAQAIGRLGNWFNRELFGSPTDLPWGLQIDDSGIFYHPTFLYEAVWNLLGAIILYSILAKRMRTKGENGSLLIKPAAGEAEKKTVQKYATGYLFNLYVIWYTFGRTFIELLRTDPSEYFYGWRLNSFIAACICIVAILVLIIHALLNKFRKPKKEVIPIDLPAEPTHYEPTLQTVKEVVSKNVNHDFELYDDLEPRERFTVSGIVHKLGRQHHSDKKDEPNSISSAGNE